MKFDHNIFRKCAIVESLTHERPRMHQINPELVAQIPIDSSLRNLLQTEKLSQYDFAKITREVQKFTKAHLARMKSNEIKAIDQFYDEKIFNPNMIDNTGLFHERIAEYPAILWTLQQITERKKEDLQEPEHSQHENR
jgi:hypothetical protein